VELTATGLAGDRQFDPHHGGSDKAVYAYANAGDPIAVVDRPHHGVRVCDLATGPHATEMRRLLDSGIPLATTVRAKAHRVLRRSTGAPTSVLGRSPLPRANG
jgi:MOSC domain-containing protein YiiM